MVLAVLIDHPTARENAMNENETQEAATMTPAEAPPTEKTKATKKAKVPKEPKAAKEKDTKTAKAPKTEPTAPQKVRKERTPKEEGLCVFALRMSEPERTKLHETAGARGATRFARAVLIAAANGDESAFRAALKEARKLRG